MDAKAREIAIKILKAIEYVDDFWEEDLGKVEALISSALSAQVAEVERMREGLMDARAQIESFGMSHRSDGNEAEYDRSLRCLFCIDALMGNP